MLLKMLLDFRDDLAWKASAGSIVKWYKREGDRVNYGDDLCDFKIEEFALPVKTMELGELAMQMRPDALARYASEQLRNQDFDVDDVDVGHADGLRSRSQATCFMRVTSSDTGVLRKLCAEAGERRQAGDLLAVLSTEPAETLEPDLSFRTASVFRIVANMFHEGPDSSPVDVPTSLNRTQEVREHVSPNAIILRTAALQAKRVGIYLKGSRYLNAMFACAPLIRPVSKGACSILRGDTINLRSDMLLQARCGERREWVAQQAPHIDSVTGQFQTELFEKTFLAPGSDGLEEFPKTMVALSVVPDVLAACYRHRELGFLVEPGQAFSNKLAEAGAHSVGELKWFRDQFAYVGRISVEQFFECFGRVVDILQRETGAHVLVFNTLDTVSGNRTHNYAYADNNPRVRRMEFNLALAELSRKLDFPIVDVDRIVKRAGVCTQINWDNLDPKLNLAVAREVFGIMCELGVLGG